MEFLFRLLKIGIVAAILYAAYYFFIKVENQDKPVTYSIEKSGPVRDVESPESIIGKTFTSDEGISIYFESEKVCKVMGTNEEKGFKVKGTPKFKYRKKNKQDGVLKLTFTISREKGREIQETEYTYEYEMKFTKPKGGKTNCNYVFIHKIGAGDNIRSYTEANNRPTWFELD